jgi:hypothetical protein
MWTFEYLDTRDMNEPFWVRSQKTDDQIIDAANRMAMWLAISADNGFFPSARLVRLPD